MIHAFCTFDRYPFLPFLFKFYEVAGLGRGIPCVLPPSLFSLAMALASCEHIFQAPGSLPNLSEKTQDLPPASRISLLPTKELLKRRKSKSHSRGTTAASPQALSAPPLVHLSSCHQEELFDSGNPSLTIWNWHTLEAAEDENLLTELKRSELESQWAHTKNCNRTPQREMLLGCGKLSARQRRFVARRRGISSSRMVCGKPTQCLCDVGSMSASSASSSSELAKESFQEALQGVNTIGYMKSRLRRELLTKEEEIWLSKKLKVGQNLRAVRKRITQTLGHDPPDEVWALSVNLSFKELKSKLIEADRARDLMFLANLGLVISVASRYTRFGINLADLVQEGAAGLLRGLQKFDHTKGFKLSTYVHWWIRQGVTQTLGEHSKTVRIPSHMQAKLTLVNQTIAKLKEEGLPVSVKSLSKALNMPDEVVSVVLKTSRRMTSLDRHKTWGNVNTDGDSMHNYIADPCAQNNPWSIVDNMFLREHIDDLIESTLCKREQEIVRLYYGFDCPKGNGISHQRISDRMGMSRERIRQVEGRALRKLVATGRQMGLGVPLAYQ